MSARAAILGAVAAGLNRDSDKSGGEKAVAERLSRHARSLIPARGDLDRSGRIDLFADLIAQVDATVDRVAANTDVPGALAVFLRDQNLPARAVRAPDPRLDAIPWADQPQLDLHTGKAVPADEVSVTGAFGAIAETGTLMLTSGPDSPTTLNFLPETHVVVLWADQITGNFESQWDALRSSHGEGKMPRTVNFITGPSRSADIEQTLQLGAHGPRRLHVIIVDEPPPETAR
ncbi:MAG: lactate utilization protein [Bauldia litoralis]